MPTPSASSTSSTQPRRFARRASRASPAHARGCRGDCAQAGRPGGRGRAGPDRANCARVVSLADIAVRSLGADHFPHHRCRPTGRPRGATTISVDRAGARRGERPMNLASVSTLRGLADGPLTGRAVLFMLVALLRPRHRGEHRHGPRGDLDLRRRRHAELLSGRASPSRRDEAAAQAQDARGWKVNAKLAPAAGGDASRHRRDATRPAGRSPERPGGRALAPPDRRAPRRRVLA